MLPKFLDVPTDIRIIINGVIHREGGFSDDIVDLGGPTKFGITFATFQRWCNSFMPAEEDLQRIKQEEAVQIYYQLFWKKMPMGKFDNPWLKEFMFDWMIHAGISKPAKELQELVGAKADGAIGSKSRAAINKFMSRMGDQGPGKIVDLRIYYYVNNVQRIPGNVKFLEGWIRRANEFRYKNR